MPSKSTYLIEKIIDNKLQSNILKKFSAQYKKEEWDKLCLNHQFVEQLLEQNIEKNQILADEILGINRKENK